MLYLNSMTFRFFFLFNSYRKNFAAKKKASHFSHQDFLFVFGRGTQSSGGHHPNFELENSVSFVFFRKRWDLSYIAVMLFFKTSLGSFPGISAL